MLYWFTVFEGPAGNGRTQRSRSVSHGPRATTAVSALGFSAPDSLAGGASRFCTSRGAISSAADATRWRTKASDKTKSVELYGSPRRFGCGSEVVHQ